MPNKARWTAGIPSLSDYHDTFVHIGLFILVQKDPCEPSCEQDYCPKYVVCWHDCVILGNAGQHVMLPQAVFEQTF